MVNGAYRRAHAFNTADGTLRLSLFLLGWGAVDSMSKERPPEPLDFFIWTVE
ncbi:hypothetical protein HAX54_001454, partial [Datura stramonium]|nr:hypothetical protein [Datura stramonium]